MGDVSDFYAVSNSIDIQHLRAQQNSQMRLTEFNERVATLARETGVTAKGFFTFERENPTPREKSKASKWLWGIIAGVVAFSLHAAIPIILGVTALGFGIGSLIPEHETQRMDRALGKYEVYLNQTEAAARSGSRARTVQQDASIEPELSIRNDHAEKLLAQRSEQQHESRKTL